MTNLPQRHDGAPVDYAREDEPLPPFRHWVEADYAEPDRGPMRVDVLAILLGLSLGLWVVVGLAAWKFWPAIEGAFQ